MKLYLPPKNPQGNIAVIDETKGAKDSFYIFGGLIFKNPAARNSFERFTNETLKYGKELKGSDITEKNFHKKEKQLISIFDRLKKDSIDKKIKMIYYIISKTLIDKIGTHLRNNIENNINHLRDINYFRDKTEIIKVLYIELLIWLIDKLSNFPFKKDFIEQIICDNIYSLNKTTETLFPIVTNLSNEAIPFINKKNDDNIAVFINYKNALPKIIEGLHGLNLTPYGRFLAFINFKSSLTIRAY